MHHHDHGSPGKRNRYFAGKRLKEASFAVEQAYHVERRRLINRAMHGHGVVYGYPLAFDAGADGAPAWLRIGAGLALDRHGRELAQVDGRTLTAAEAGLTQDALSQAGRDALAAAPPRAAPRWLLRAHYATTRQGPVRVGADCGCEEHEEYDYVCETVSYSLEPEPPAQARTDAGALACDCRTAPATDASFRRGAPACLCAHVAGLDLAAPGPDAVALAWVGVARDARGDPQFTGVLDACGPRRLVKRNDLLFDLIRGADLTRIEDISWRSLHGGVALVPWKEFRDYFDIQSGVTNFTVTFSGPVQTRSITVDCFAITVLIKEASSWVSPLRVPLAQVDLAPPGDGDPPGSTRSATLVVDTRWARGELAPTEDSIFGRSKSRVEIEVRGDAILDLCGQAIDANARGPGFAPSGNGTPGGTFLSVFRVGQAPQQPDD